MFNRRKIVLKAMQKCSRETAVKEVKKSVEKCVPDTRFIV